MLSCEQPRGCVLVVSGLGVLCLVEGGLGVCS